ncbi:MAG TPA: hypothetical protein PLX77_00855, partial [Candidatus Cloacimonadota bacterium]|nr:hypothetical protein [Candidatus Cloacimonadota bacterium]
MKRIELLIIVMLLVISYAYADGYRTDDDHWEKVRQMDELAERFKAETGFVGDINPDSPLTHLTGFRGNFPDIPFSASADSVTFRQACERIVDRILPYTSTNRSQLSMSRISKSVIGYSTEYHQQVGGYRVESRGLILITFDEERSRFSISNGTVELPEGDVNVNITKEQAFQIARSAFEKTDLCNENTPSWRHNTVIQFKSRTIDDVQLPYRLCWRVTFPGRSYYIDAETGNWFVEGYVINQQITCDVVGTMYSKDSSFGSLGHQAMMNTEVNNGGIDPYYTNDSGIAFLDDYPTEWFQVNYQSDRFSVRTQSSPSTLFYKLYTQTPTGVRVELPDSLYCTTDNGYYAHYAPNILHHMNEQDVSFCTVLSSFSSIGYPTMATDCNIPDLGEFDPRSNEMRIRNGRNSHVIRHEASHYFTYNTMGNHQFFELSNPDTTNPGFAKPFQAMEEAFAEYWTSVGLNSTLHNYGRVLDITTYDVNSIYQDYYSASIGLNEIFYSQYWNRYPLASAWWALRSDENFSPTAVNNLLVNGLDNVSMNIPMNDGYRYKPRYFYNILMKQVDTDDTSWPFNPEQAAIDSVYSTRGFHFYPKVKSVASDNIEFPFDQESFTVLDSVYVHVSNYPQ